MNRALLAPVAACTLLASAPATAAAQSQTTPARILWACYVPLTGTVYRISPDGSDAGLRTACSSTTHVKFSWNEQGPPALSGYEVVAKSFSIAFSPPSIETLRTRCLQFAVASGTTAGCLAYETDYRATRSAVPVFDQMACPAGKKVIGATGNNGGAFVSTSVLADGETVMVEGVAAVRTREFIGPITSANFPSSTPVNFTVQLICASVT